MNERSEICLYAVFQIFLDTNILVNKSYTDILISIIIIFNKVGTRSCKYNCFSLKELKAFSPVTIK